MTRTPFAVEIVTLVPTVWPAMLGPTTGLTGRAFEDGEAELRVRDMRTYGKGPHRQVDDSPFGGGAGMVLCVEPLHRAIEDARARTPGPVIMLTPRGRRFDQKLAQELSQGPGMTLVCGRYEGFDERARQYVDMEVSLGDFVLTAGDPAALSIIDATVRLLPGVLGNPESLSEESHGGAGLEYPQYTRPAEYDGVAVPPVLRSGDHAAVARWRREAARQITATHRPDLLPQAVKIA
jgi:tRNA (guanine37-N1)-methyltransferase